MKARGNWNKDRDLTIQLLHTCSLRKGEADNMKAKVWNKRNEVSRKVWPSERKRHL